MEKEHDKDWLKSKEVEKALKISSCDLMHMRMAGKLRFEKRGNSFLYKKEDVDSKLDQS
ncbi:MAG: hypothetical protein ABJN36_18250 [Cyclobacteriaceae bacterium]